MASWDIAWEFANLTAKLPVPHEWQNNYLSRGVSTDLERLGLGRRTQSDLAGLRNQEKRGTRAL